MMKLVVALSVLVAFADAAETSAQTQALEMHRSAVTAPQGATWQEARSTRGSFRINMPVPFNDYTIPGSPVRHVVDGKGPTGISFSVVEFVKQTDKPEMDAIYKDLIDSPVKTRNMKREKSGGADILSYGSYGGPTNSYNRYVETSHSFYFIHIVYPPSREAEVESLRDAFFGSFVTSETAK
jgi:hypothetical protein